MTQDSETVEEFTVMGDDSEGGWIVDLQATSREQAAEWARLHGEGYVVSRTVSEWQRVPQ